MTILPTEAEIAGACVEIHLELMEIWRRAEFIEDLVSGYKPVGIGAKFNPSKQAADLESLALQCAGEYSHFHSMVADWFVRAGNFNSERETLRLSKFAFEQELYEFKNRAEISPFVIDMVKGVRIELEALHLNVIPVLVATLQERQAVRKADAIH